MTETTNIKEPGYFAHRPFYHDLSTMTFVTLDFSIALEPSAPLVQTPPGLPPGVVNLIEL